MPDRGQPIGEGLHPLDDGGGPEISGKESGEVPVPRLWGRADGSYMMAHRQLHHGRRRDPHWVKALLLPT